MSGSRALSVGFLGRIPPALGGGGLERQMDHTAAALERLGHQVVGVEAAAPEQRLDLLHAFGSEPAVWHQLQHWTRNRVPLVLTPVIVVSPGRQELAMRLAARLRRPRSGARMRAELLSAADIVIAGTEYERRLVTHLGDTTAVVIGNGGDPSPPGTRPQGTPPPGFALLVGQITARKRQLEVVRALAGRVPVVVAGEFAGSAAEMEEWHAAIGAPGVTWLGHVAEPGAVAALQRDAGVFVHLSAAEVQSLAVVEALAQGTPAVLSDIPGHRELAARYPGAVEIVASAEAVAAAVGRLVADPPPAAAGVPTWDDVAARIVAVYERLA